ncbi:hypothetical protein NDN08_001059 [Rhodosorus marinus]|uniref:Eukaryotic translation initiation factor 3 subunit M n=1 Tax=Rhodosorus marinus TaxID=101924 RepID=A0AAV8UVF6_9RHOD|nr:hypothetical protein NDN08_001059 [Rhodosorus marinus]
MAPEEVEDAGMMVEEQSEDKSLYEALVAALSFLSKRSGQEDLLASVEQAQQAEDFMYLMSLIANGYVAALNAPVKEDDDEVVVSENFEGCIQVIVGVFRMVCNMETDLVVDIAAGLCANENLGDMRMRSLAFLYNSLPTADAARRFKFLVMLIELSAKLQAVDKLDSVFSRVPDYVKGYDLNVEDKRMLYSRCSEALKSTEALEKALDFNVQLLETYNGCADEELDSISDVAKSSVVDAIALPKLFKLDMLLEMSAVVRLKDKGNANLYRLLEIFVKDDLTVYKQFYAENGGLVDSLGLSNESLTDKMRLLTFATLGNKSNELGYQAIETALDIPEEEVEEWVIRAISSGLIVAKMNQVTRTVHVHRSTSRSFSPDQWQPLGERIRLWTRNVEELLSVLRSSKTSAY